jgi:hypothetical protein
MQQGWIGVDLDGTLAEYDARRGIEHIGRIVQPMLNRVRSWLNAGITVKIFTARATDATLTSLVKPWLRDHNLPDLEVTNCKDSQLLQIWDDRAIQVEINTGHILTPRQYLQLVPNGWVGMDFDGVLAQCTTPQSLFSMGEPVETMLNRVKQWQMVDVDVRLFTARAGDPAQVAMIAEWLQDHGLKPMRITDQKDFQMAQFFDCHAVHVIHNMGEPSSQETGLPTDWRYC